MPFLGDGNTKFNRRLQGVGHDATPLGDEHQVVLHAELDHVPLVLDCGGTQ